MRSADRTCMVAPVGRAAYCGSTSTPIVPANEATCVNCLAAFRADERRAKQ